VGSSRYIFQWRKALRNRLGNPIQWMVPRTSDNPQLPTNTGNRM